MQPQDTYNRAFDDAIAELDGYIETLKDVVRIERENTGAYWRARLEPHEPNTCAVELMLSRAQKFDIDVGTESLVDQPVAGGLPLFLPLLQALADGHVVKRTWSATATGCELTREVIVKLDDGQDWSIRRLINAGTATTEMTSTARDHAYVPYRRRA